MFLLLPVYPFETLNIIRTKRLQKLQHIHKFASKQSISMLYQGSHQVTNFLKPEFPHLSCCFANDFCGNGSTSESCIWHHLVRRDWGNSKTWGKSSFIGGFHVTLGCQENLVQFLPVTVVSFESDPKEMVLWFLRRDIVKQHET